MSQPTDPAIVRNWLKALGSLVAGSLSEVEAKARIDAYTPLLATAFPPAAFTPTTLRRVAEGCKFFPSYGEVNALLVPEYRRAVELAAAASAPIARPALTAPEPPPHEGQDPEAVDAVRKLVEAFKAERTFSQPQGSAARAKIKPAHGSDGQLLAAYEKLAREGSDAAATRAAMIRQRLGATA